MSSRHDDKSAPKEYCKNEGEHDHAEHDGHINLSAPSLEPVSHLDVSGSQMCSTTSSSDSKEIKKTLRIPPRRLAFCGGGVRCVSHVGVLKALESANLLACVKEVIGVSGGSLFALLFALGYKVAQIEELSVNFDFNLLGAIEPEDILLFPMTLGLNSGDIMDKLITSILEAKGHDKDITFSELAKKSRLTLRSYATELEKSKIKEMSVWTTPNMSVKTAVRASMSLPIMYSPVKEGESLLVDGGLLHNLPLIFLTEAEIQETWGVLFVPEEQTCVGKIESILDFFKYVYEGALIMRNIPYIQKYKENLILLRINGEALGFSESKKRREEFIELARRQTLLFLKSSTRPPLSRRYSVS